MQFFCFVMLSVDYNRFHSISLGKHRTIVIYKYSEQKRLHNCSALSWHTWLLKVQNGRESFSVLKDQKNWGSLLSFKIFCWWYVKISDAAVHQPLLFPRAMEWTVTVILCSEGLCSSIQGDSCTRSAALTVAMGTVKKGLLNICNTDLLMAARM